MKQDLRICCALCGIVLSSHGARVLGYLCGSCQVCCGRTYGSACGLGEVGPLHTPAPYGAIHKAALCLRRYRAGGVLTV